MSDVSSDSSAQAGAAYKQRERLLIGAALLLVVCRLVSARNSIAAMVIATLVLTAALACYVRGSLCARWWAFRAVLPLVIGANTVALAVGALVTFLAESGLLVHNRLGMFVEWNRVFVCVPLAALINLLAWGSPVAARQLRTAAWIANGVLTAYAGWFWRVHESYDGFGGAPPLGADLIAALAGISLMALAWGPSPVPASPSSGRSVATGRWRTILVVTSVAIIGGALVQPFYVVLRRCRLEAELTSLGCEVTDRTRRPAWLRIRELAPLRPCVTEIEAVYLPKDCLTPDNCQAMADCLGRVSMLDEVDAPGVPAGCERLLSGLGPGSYMQYLTLSGEGVTDDALATAGGFRRLRRATFAKSRITDAGLARLAGLPWLETLVLRDAPINGDGLAALATCPTLRVLDLSGTQIGDEQVTILKQLPRLSDLDVTDTPMTETGVAELQAALPQCEIRWGTHHD